VRFKVERFDDGELGIILPEAMVAYLGVQSGDTLEAVVKNGVLRGLPREQADNGTPSQNSTAFSPPAE
jgi:antitoxin component of MazEF toxin-antitoxin module